MRKMIVSSKSSGSRQQALPAGVSPVPVRLDTYVLVPALLLLAIGVVMVGSASIAIAEGQGASSYHYLLRHLIFIALGVLLASSLRIIPVSFLERISRPLMGLSILY